MDDVAPARRSPRRAMLLAAAAVTAAALFVAAIVMITGEEDVGLVSNPYHGDFTLEELAPSDPDRRTRVLAVDPGNGQVLWATDVAGHAWSAGLAPNGLVLPYSGRLHGTPGVVALGYDGEPSWQTTFQTNGESTPPLVHLNNGDLLVASPIGSLNRGPRQLARINGDSGELVWSTDLEFSPADLEVVGDQAILFRATVGFVGVDLAGGAVLWEASLGDTKWSMRRPTAVGDAKRSSGDAVYFTVSSEGRSGIVGVNTAGAIFFEIEVPHQTEIIRLDGDAMITMSPGTVSRYSALTGEVVWTRAGLAHPQTYETVGDTALISDAAAQRLLGVSVETGETLWGLDSGQSRKMVSNDADRFYVWHGSEEENTLVAIDAASGSEQWTFTAPGVLRDGAPSYDGIVYAATSHRVPQRILTIEPSQGVFAALDAATGAVLWTLDFEFGFEAMAVHNDVLYIITTHGA